MAVVGRFQPFHWGHFEYLAEAATIGGPRLTVGITNPSPTMTRSTPLDKSRSTPSSNPFSFDQRKEMIARSFTGIDMRVDLDFRPCDLRSITSIRSSLGDCQVVAITIYDAWGLEKQRLMEEAGYDVRVLWRRSEKLVSGTEVRERLRARRPWEHLVPSGTASVINSADVNY
ncbi:adenylyltransferase/cytidyltransferase family protein [Glycomyces harbinensis]|uniref:adenylyltransferase/cytidyltransferase family protein n=1 Tax=Glycomyces harbinensis TaxID=58114 RepID=UPI0015A5DA45|nr:adenylyltransferase/cytidyltransferase family protein [Glycomyces harbinensis]